MGSPPGTWEDPPGNHLGKTSQRGSLVLGLVYVQQGSGGNPFERGYAGLEKAASTRAASSSWTRGSALDSRQRHGSTQTDSTLCVCMCPYQILRDSARPDKTVTRPFNLGSQKSEKPLRTACLQPLETGNVWAPTSTKTFENRTCLQL